jgi:uncharacterized protein YndB with AHSA1/START domain
MTPESAPVSASHSGLRVSTPDHLTILIERRFAAVRERVWDAMTRPELVRAWLSGPPGWSMTECTDPLEVGGRFRCVWTSTAGASMAMTGVYRELSRPERIVRTESFEFGCDAQSGEQLCSLELVERNNGTDLPLTIRYDSREARDGSRLGDGKRDRLRV